MALKRAIAATFDLSDWTELGHLTGTTDLLDNHARLYRSLRFGDDDYGACILDVLPAILGEEDSNLAEVEKVVHLEPWLRQHDPAMHSELYGATMQLEPEDLATLEDASAIEAHLRRIRGSIETDPEHAVGAAKELIESTTKLVLNTLGQPVSARAQLPALVKEAQVALALHPGMLAPTARGVDSAKKVLSGLTSIAIGVDELRNHYGTGHGKLTAVSGLKPRHAQMAVDAATAYCRTLLATLADPDAPWRRR